MRRFPAFVSILPGACSSRAEIFRILVYPCAVAGSVTIRTVRTYLAGFIRLRLRIFRKADSLLNRAQRTPRVFCTCSSAAVVVVRGRFGKVVIHAALVGALTAQTGARAKTCYPCSVGATFLMVFAVNTPPLRFGSRSFVVLRTSKSPPSVFFEIYFVYS